MNAKKCELSSSAQPPPGVPKDIPFVPERDAWSYLGVPLAERSNSAFAGVVRRLEALSEGLCGMAGSYPRQVLQLLRSTMGACRVEYLLQSLPPSDLLEAVAKHR